MRKITALIILIIIVFTMSGCEKKIYLADDNKVGIAVVIPVNELITKLEDYDSEGVGELYSDSKNGQVAGRRIKKLVKKNWTELVAEYNSEIKATDIERRFILPLFKNTIMYMSCYTDESIPEGMAKGISVGEAKETLDIFTKSFYGQQFSYNENVQNLYKSFDSNGLTALDRNGIVMDSDQAKEIIEKISDSENIDKYNALFLSDTFLDEKFYFPGLVKMIIVAGEKGDVVGEKLDRVQAKGPKFEAFFDNNGGAIVVYRKGLLRTIAYVGVLLGLIGIIYSLSAAFERK